eukprot:gnl/Chilomastix_cuspidata/4687.p2 GENE.gnl/Chilomastix_cuspidata/4687~~gnl/Chilomastix_cuspidata/4687.p2  ORF type:complete len:353 (+),score=150.04 gnl/Chilomastix_cuspidata/4687:76-1134(+)
MEPAPRYPSSLLLILAESSIDLQKRFPESKCLAQPVAKKGCRCCAPTVLRPYPAAPRPHGIKLLKRNTLLAALLSMSLVTFGLGLIFFVKAIQGAEWYFLDNTISRLGQTSRNPAGAGYFPIFLALVSVGLAQIALGAALVIPRTRPDDLRRASFAVFWPCGRGVRFYSPTAAHRVAIVVALAAVVLSCWGVGFFESTGDRYVSVLGARVSYDTIHGVSSYILYVVPATVFFWVGLFNVLAQRATAAPARLRSGQLVRVSVPAASARLAWWVFAPALAQNAALLYMFVCKALEDAVALPRYAAWPFTEWLYTLIFFFATATWLVALTVAAMRGVLLTPRVEPLPPPPLPPCD